MTDRIAEIIQEYADNPDEIDINKVALEVRKIALEDAKRGTLARTRLIPIGELSVHQCSYCGHIGPDVHQYIGKIGGSDEPRTITNCIDIDACLKRKEEKTNANRQ